MQAKSYARDRAARATQSFLDAGALGASIEKLPDYAWMRVRYRVPMPVPSVSLVCAFRAPYSPWWTGTRPGQPRRACRLRLFGL